MEIDCDLKRLYYLNHSTHEPWHWIFVTFYTVFTASAFVCNAILLIAVNNFHSTKRWIGIPFLSQDGLIPINPRPSELRRDILISHLAILDLFLSLTMPISALDGLSKFWPFGPNTEFLCKLTKAIPTTVVYSTSMIIMLIACNCYWQIVKPHKQQITPANLKYYTFSFILIALSMSSPQYYFTKLFPVPPVTTTSPISYNTTYLPPPNTTQSHAESTVSPIGLSRINTSIESFEVATNEGNKEELIDECPELDENGWDHVIFCMEDWPFGEQNYDIIERLYYTVFSFILQFVIPLVVISICYLMVYCQLRKQSFVRRSLHSWNVTERLQMEEIRRKRRNKHLAVISIFYLIAWFPLGLISVLLDSNPSIFGNNTSHITIIFLSCHLLGMLSATVNPIIYGYKNKHIRQGKKLVLKKTLYTLYITKYYDNRFHGLCYISEILRMSMCLSLSLKGTRSTRKSDSIAMIPVRNSSSDNLMNVEKNSPRRMHSLTIERSQGLLGPVMTRKKTM